MPDVDRFIRDIENIRVSTLDGRPKPHKLLLLLAVIDLADAGVLTENRVYLNDALYEKYQARYLLLSDPSDWCQIGPPFFHLRSAPFWHHKIKEGREAAYHELTTSGGGVKRIRDNIEYAYLSDYAWEVIADPLAREQLHDWLMLMVMGVEKKGVAFHESFYLQRARLSQMLRISAAIPVATDGSKSRRHLDFNTIYSEGTLGKRQVKAMRGYARAAGLFDAFECLSAFGRHAYNHDPCFENLTTQWCIHYHLSAPHRCGPIFWPSLLPVLSRPGTIADSETIRALIAQFIAGQGQKPLAAQTLRSTATIFLETYAEDEGLGRLGILRKEASGRYVVTEPEPPAWLVFAYVLADYWDAVWAARPTMNLAGLMESGGPADLLFLSEGQVNEYLRRMEQEGLIEQFRVAPPYQVARLWHSADSILERLYEA